MATGKTWKKQLFRVQQMADQKLGRSEKTEVLNEELQSLEKRVEVISKACHATSKRLKDLFGGIPPDERKLKKMPESGLSFSLIESGNLLDQTSLGQAMKQCGDVEGFLAKERLVLEMEIEQHVMAPLNSVVEVDVPAINKQKRHLKQNILDMDGAKNRHVSAVKAHQEGKINASKVESIREEMEEAINKVEQCRDQHATDTYSFVARETEFSKVLLELMTLQMDYHRRAWERLQAVVPEIQEQIESSVHMPVFGQSLAEHLKSTNRKIAMVIEQSVLALLQCGMEEEGLFRIAGGASKVKKLRAFLDSNMVDMEEFENDPHTIAGTFKQYLRELPEPLLTYELYDEWMQAAHLPQEERLAGLWTVLGKLPEDNYNNLRYLVKFLAKLAEKSDVNKMTTSNIAIVMGPNLLWPAGENGPSVLSTGMQSGILEAMVSNADWFFQGEEQFDGTGTSNDYPTTAREVQELPYPVNPPSNSHVDGNLPTNPFTSLTVESAENNTGASPKQPRKKKHAPQPPQPKAAIPTDDQKVVIREKTNSLGRPVPVIPPEGVKSNSLGRLESMKTTQRPDKPAGITVPITDVPVSPHSPLSPGLQKERPRGPPPERPTAPPPDKPPHSSSPERQQLSDIPEGSSETKVPPEKPTPPAVIISKTVSDKSAFHSDKSEPTNEKPAAVMEKSGPPVERQMSDKKPAPPKDKPEKPAPPTDKSGDSLDKVIPAPSEKPPEKPPPPTERPTVSHDRSEKPEKPDKPPAPSLISSISFRASEKPERPAKPVLTEKPILEEKPILKSGDYVPGHQRQLSGGGSGQRPPRPTPPPPPRPVSRTEDDFSSKHIERRANQTQNTYL